MKSYLSKPTYVYVKVKLGAGPWWANTQRPAIWMLNYINKGDVSRGLFGEDARILGKRYYRWYGSDLYDIYLTMLLKVNKTSNGYNFQRSPLSVGSPVDIQFPLEEVTGTVTALSRKPFDETVVDKIIYLARKYAYLWEYDAIHVGDIAFDGEDKFFEILEKSNSPENLFSYNNSYSNLGSNLVEPSNYVFVKARVKLRKVGDQWILGEDQLIVPGRSLNIALPTFVFENYVVTKIE